MTDPSAADPPPSPPGEAEGAVSTPARTAPPRPWMDRVRAVALPLVLLGGAGLLGGFGHHFYPVQHWLFWIYARAWLEAGVWALACAGVGHLVVRRLLGRTLPFAEHLVMSFATGVYAFFVLMFLAGLLRLYGTVLFFALPLGMLAVSGLPFFRYLRRVHRHLAVARRRSGPTPWWVHALLAFGLLGLLMVYFVILTPENVQFDSRWKHIAVAEEYVAQGGMRRAPEGWTVVTYPHLSSFLFAWAFMSPKASLFTKVEIAAHMEYVVFLGSVWSISAIVRYLVPRADIRVAWVARFLFPGVLLYDSSVSLGADHVAALFVGPIFLLSMRAWRDLSPRMLTLMVMMLASGVLVKYTSLLMLFPLPVGMVVVRALHLGLLRLRGKLPAADPRYRSWYLGPLTALGMGLLFTAPHWLKNLIWYRDPLYPQLHAWITPNPWTPDAADLFEWGYKDHQFWRPSRDLEGVLRTLRALVDFSFIPNDYGRYHGQRPTMGSIFTLGLACLPFLRGTKRTWALVGFVELSVLVWYWTHHQDRYLQTILPWLAAAAAASLVLVWRSGWPARAAASALVGVQIVWGGDVYFIPTHAMIRSPVKAVVDLLGEGYKHNYEARFRIFSPWSDIGQALPDRARVLLHDNHVHAGLGASQVSDWGGWQFGISYGRLETPRAVHDMYRTMGISHLVWEKQVSKGWDSVAGDLVFFQYALAYGKAPKAFGKVILAAMPVAPPPETPFGDVAYLGCEDQYKTGMYRIEDLRVPVFGPKHRKFPKPRKPGPARGASTDAFVAEAELVVLDTKCHQLSAQVKSQLTLAARRLVVKRARGASKHLELWLRKGGALEAPAATPEVPPPAGEPDEDEPFGEEDGEERGR